MINIHSANVVYKRLLESTLFSEHVTSWAWISRMESHNKKKEISNMSDVSQTPDNNLEKVPRQVLGTLYQLSHLIVITVFR